MVQVLFRQKREIVRISDQAHKRLDCTRVILCTLNTFSVVFTLALLPASRGRINSNIIDLSVRTISFS